MTTTAAPPPKKPLPPPPAKAPSNGAATAPRTPLTISTGKQLAAQRIVIFGTSAIGKTELAANIKQTGIEPLFFDLERGSNNLDVARVSGIESLDSLRDGLHSEEMLSSYGAIVIDSGTTAQELCEAWVCTNIKTEKGHSVKAISEYPYGKGVEYTYDAFLNLMGDFDAQIRRGRHVIVICHQCTELVPNAEGEDYLQYQPRLQMPKSGKSSIRHRLIEWCDAVAFVGYDKAVNSDGKAVGSGTRCIYLSERPTYLAKSRTVCDPIVYEKGSAELWRQLLNK